MKTINQLGEYIFPPLFAALTNHTTNRGQAYMRNQKKDSQGEKAMIDKAFWKSKKFWAMIAGALIPVLQQMGIAVPPETLWAVLVYLGAQGVADIGKGEAK